MLTRRRFLKYLGGLTLVSVLPGVLPVTVPEAFVTPMEVLTSNDVPEGYVCFLDSRALWLVNPGQPLQQISWSMQQEEELEWKS